MKCALVFLIYLFSFIQLSIAKHLRNSQSLDAIQLSSSNFSHYPYVIPPIFTDPNAKLQMLSNFSFTEQLFNQALNLEPLLGRAGVQVNMGFWSGIRSTGSNHGSLVRLIDSINSFNTDPSQIGPQITQRAIWDEGISSSYQYPLYVLQINEYWYERSSIPITIRGIQYPDQYFVEFAKADLIWGLYSQRYADMAILIHQTTGRVPQAWCFVNGARQARIFYQYELPELIKLEASGDIIVNFAFTEESDWRHLEQWATGTQLAPKPLPRRLTTSDLQKFQKRYSKICGHQGNSCLKNPHLFQFISNNSYQSLV